VRAVRVAERTQLRRQLRRGVQRPAESGPEFLPSAAGEKLPEQIRVRHFGGKPALAPMLLIVCLFLPLFLQKIKKHSLSLRLCAHRSSVTA